jgi:hypothetical protein
VSKQVKLRLIVDRDGYITFGYDRLLPPNFIATIENGQIVKMERIQ